MSKLISLRVNCPHCEKSLMDYTQFVNYKPSIKTIVEVEGKKGTLYLCSLYGCYDHICECEMPKDKIAHLSCPHCQESLKGSDTCRYCGAPMIHFQLEKGGNVMICSRVGCDNHYVAFEDIYDELSQFYDEFDYGSPEGMSEY